MTNDELRARADEILHERWRVLMDDCRPESEAEATGAALALYLMGFINNVELECWEARFKRCPTPDGHVGGRAWCAYCGDVDVPGAAQRNKTPHSSLP